MKPNILFINSITLYGGGEVWMLTVMNELAARGYKVSFICKPEAEIIKYSDNKSIDVHRAHQCHFTAVRTLSDAR